MSSSPVCAYCRSDLATDAGRHACPACGAEYHDECWSENGGCAVYGCKETPVVDARPDIEAPVSWWGRENKPCPQCGAEILAAAVRCRHCGATFASARPESSAEFQRKTKQASREPELRRNVIWQFVLSVFPLTAPLGAAMGLVWYLPNREDVHALSGAAPGFARLALIVALIQTALLATLTALYAVLRAPG